LLSMPGQATSRLPANFDPALLNASLQANGPSITQDMSPNPSLAIAVSRAPGQVLQGGQGSQKGNAGGSDRVRIFLTINFTFADSFHLGPYLARRVSKVPASISGHPQSIGLARWYGCEAI
jgi:hypothetical protein